MSNMRICGANAVDDSRCVLTCSVIDILDVENLQDISRSKILRVAAAAGIEVKGTYGGEDIAASFMSPIRHNLTGDGLFRFQGYSGPAWTGLVIDTGDRSAVSTAMLEALDFGIGELGVNIFSPTYREKRSTVWFDDEDMVLFTTPVIQSWKLTISEATHPELYLDISRLWIGEHYEFDENPELGSDGGPNDDSVTWRTDAGGARTDAALPFRASKLDLPAMTEADRAYLAKLASYCGSGRRSFFLSVLPELLNGFDESAALIMQHEGEFIFKNPLPRPAFAEGGKFSATMYLEEA